MFSVGESGMSLFLVLYICLVPLCTLARLTYYFFLWEIKLMLILSFSLIQPYKKYTGYKYKRLHKIVSHLIVLDYWSNTQFYPDKSLLKSLTQFTSEIHFKLHFLWYNFTGQHRPNPKNGFWRRKNLFLGESLCCPVNPALSFAPPSWSPLLRCEGMLLIGWQGSNTNILQ